MKQTATALIIAGAVTALAATAHAQARSQGDRAADVVAIRAHIESIFQAFVDKDLRALERTHGMAWRGLTSGSRQVIRGRDGYLKSASAAATLPKGQGTLAYRISDFDVVFYGDTAVASFVADVDVAFDGDKATQRIALMDVYHQEPAGWIQVASSTFSDPEESRRDVSRLRPLTSDERASILAAREAVWRAWFAGDSVALARLVPAELITLEPSGGPFGTRESVLAGSRGFAATGAKLTRLAFPRTELQAYGATVILYTTYETDVMKDGRTETERGLATEVFVRQDDRWINTAWQLAPASRR